MKTAYYRLTERIPNPDADRRVKRGFDKAVAWSPGTIVRVSIRDPDDNAFPTRLTRYVFGTAPEGWVYGRTLYGPNRITEWVAQKEVRPIPVEEWPPEVWNEELDRLSVFPGEFLTHLAKSGVMLPHRLAEELEWLAGQLAGEDAR